MNIQTTQKKLDDLFEKNLLLPKFKALQCWFMLMTESSCFSDTGCFCLHAREPANMNTYNIRKLI